MGSALRINTPEGGKEGGLGGGEVDLQCGLLAGLAFIAQGTVELAGPSGPTLRRGLGLINKAQDAAPRRESTRPGARPFS